MDKNCEASYNGESVTRVEAGFLFEIDGSLRPPGDSASGLVTDALKCSKKEFFDCLNVCLSSGCFEKDPVIKGFNRDSAQYPFYCSLIYEKTDS